LIDAQNFITAELIGSEFPERIIVVGTHYDSIRGGPGANDNASGIAGTLELAKILKKQSLKNTLRFTCLSMKNHPTLAQKIWEV
jgi:Zn-dependent M28 family amino/carboxypeptidase